MARRLSPIVALLACLLFVACGGSDGSSAFDDRVEGETTAAADDGAGVTQDEVLVGIHGPKSAQAAALVADVFTGFHDYVDEVNERGGVHGRRIRLIEVDDQFTVAGGTAAAKRLAQDDVLLAINIAGADAQVGAQPTMEQHGIPYLTAAASMQQLEDARSTFLIATPVELQAAAVPSFVAGELDGRDRRVAILHETGDIYTDMVEQVEANAGEAGIEIVATEAVESQAPSFNSALVKLRRERADTVILIGLLAVPGILRDAQAVGFEPTWTGAGPWATDFFAALTRGGMDGIRAVRGQGGVDSPSFPAFRAAWSGDTPPGDLGFGGWVTGETLEAILERAGEQPSRAGIVELLERTMDDPIDADPASPPLRFSPDRHWGSDEVLPSRVEGDMWVATGDWAARFE